MKMWEKALFAAIALSLIVTSVLGIMSRSDPSYVGAFLLSFFIMAFVWSIPGGIMDAEREAQIDAAAAKILREPGGE